MPEKEKTGGQQVDELNQTSIEERRLLEIITILKSAYTQKESPLKAEVVLGEQTLADKFKNLIEKSIPGQELKKEIEEKIEFWNRVKNTGAFKPEEIDQQITEYIDSKVNLYIDSSEHIQMYNRKYIVDSLSDRTTKIIDKEEIKPEDLGRVLHVSMDLNGLKTLNDGGAQKHETGNLALETFSKILKDGTTAKWLRDQGIEVIPAHQSGDEFMMLICGDRDMTPMTEEIIKRYSDEISSAEASNLMSFETAKAHFTELNIYDDFLKYLVEQTGVDVSAISEQELSQKKAEEEAKIIKTFKYRLGASIGVSSLGDGLSRISPDSVKNKSYKEIIKEAIGQTIGSSDEKASEHKKVSKAELAKTDPFLALIYNRSVRGNDSTEKGKLILESVQLETEVEELKVENSDLRSVSNKQEEEIRKMKEQLALLERTLSDEKNRAAELQRKIIVQEIKNS